MPFLPAGARKSARSQIGPAVGVRRSPASAPVGHPGAGRQVPCHSSAFSCSPSPSSSVNPWAANRTGIGPYPELLGNSLDYLRKGWDGTLLRSPGGTAATIVAGWRKYLTDDVPVTVLGVRRIGDEVWIEVRLETESCGEKLEGVSPATGWIPAYRLPGTRRSTWP